MATLLPKIPLESITHDAERAVARALVTTLNEEWTVYHSYSWLREHGRSGALREGEADFVILHPKHGLLVLEVKGGTVEFSSSSQVWLQNGRPMKESPFDQAGRNMHRLLDQIQQHTGWIPTGIGRQKLSCSYGYAVTFPDCRATGTAPPGGHPKIILDADALPKMGEKILAATRAWAGDGVPLAMDPAQYRALKQAVSSSFNLLPSLSRALENEAESLVRLTDDQTTVLRGLEGNTRVAIEGVAGSGKTLLALHQALRWANSGKRALFLCYNKTLAQDLQSRANHPNLTIRHFHALAREVCMRVLGAFKVPSDDVAAANFWKEEAAMLAATAFEEAPEEKFDAVVIDEAQDFHDSYWYAVEEMLSGPEAPLFYFYDRLQTLYQDQPHFPAAATRFNLLTNCRNTRSIADSCGLVIGQPIECLSGSPLGVEPQVQVVQSNDDYRTVVEALLDNLLRNEKLKPSQVAILRPLQKSPLGESNTIGRHKVTDRLEDWYAGKAIWYSTIRSFKGLEADVLLLVDVPEPGGKFFQVNDLYVACSRARLRLHVLTSAPAVQKLLREKVAAP